MTGRRSVELYDINRMVRPILIKDTVEFKTSKKVTTTNFPMNAKNVMKFMEREDMWHWTFNKHQQFGLSLGSMTPGYKHAFKGIETNVLTS